MGFVSQVVPEARYVYIVRDGRDVVASAMARWTAPLDMKYLAQKARFVPPSDLTYYAVRYGRSRLSRFGATERRLSTWGPRVAGMDAMVATRPLAEVCAYQWARCVEESDAQLAEYVDAERVHRMRYEDLVADPRGEIERLTVFLGVPRPRDGGFPRIASASVGRWRSDLADQDKAALVPLIDEVLSAHGYKP